MKILPDPTTKRGLCYKIAEIYRQKAKEQEMIVDEILPGFYGNSFFPSMIGNLLGNLSRVPHDLERKARKYEGIANSKVRIHITRISTLQKALKKLESEQTM